MPESFSSRADNGRGLIKNYVSQFHLHYTFFSSLFNTILNWNCETNSLVLGPISRHSYNSNFMSVVYFIVRRNVKSVY